MTLKTHQELVKFIQLLADRAGLCDNPLDKQLFAEAIGHLISYQYLTAQVIEE